MAQSPQPDKHFLSYVFRSRTVAKEFSSYPNKMRTNRLGYMFKVTTVHLYLLYAQKCKMLTYYFNKNG